MNSKISFNEDLLNGRPLLGFCLMYPAAGIIERIGSDWDWIWIDGQHGQHDYRSMLECVRACEIIGKPSVLRVPSHDYGSIGLALDMCVSAVMVPMVNTRLQAEEITKATKFPPLGQRSYGGRRPIDLYGRSYSNTANKDTLLIAQIETKEGLRNSEKIAAVPGIDMLFFGPDDMALQLGMPMDKPRKIDVFGKEMKKMADAARNEGKAAGTVTGSIEMLEMAFEMGYSLCVAAGDVGLLAVGSEKARKSFGSITAKSI